METDEALCERVAGGDESAFDQLVERYQRRAFRLAWSILRSAEDARDLSQEAFVRLYQTAATFQGRARFSTWFYRILVNLCVDHRRRQRWWRQVFARQEGGDAPGDGLAERAAAVEPDPVEVLGHEQAVARVWAAAATLSRQQRAVLILHAHEDLPMSEIAAVLGCSEATARVHLHRALAALRKAVGRESP